MDERRLYAILGAGAALVLVVALIDVVTGDGVDTPPTTTSAPRPSTTTSTTPATTTTSAQAAAADRIVQADLRTGLAAMKVVYADGRRYSADPTRLAAVEPSLQYVRGIATTASTPGAIYIETDTNAQVACVSARSPSGELFLIKFVAQGTAPGTWYARGSLLPARCDGERHATGW